MSKKKERFTDRVNRQFRNKQKGITQKAIEFSCRNCLNMFTFEYSGICFDKNDDIQFTPEPACPGCGATEELTFSNYGQEEIENMIFRNEIKKYK